MDFITLVEVRLKNKQIRKRHSKIVNSNFIIKMSVCKLNESLKNRCCFFFLSKLYPCEALVKNFVRLRIIIKYCLDGFIFSMSSFFIIQGSSSKIAQRFVCEAFQIINVVFGSTVQFSFAKDIRILFCAI